MKKRRAEYIDPITVSPETCCKMLDLGKTRIFELLKTGKLESTKIGNSRRILVSSIKRLAGAE